MKVESTLSPMNSSPALMDGLFGERFFERRRSPREKSNLNFVLVSDQSMLNFWQGNVLDCSPEGLGLVLVGTKPKVGSTLYVRRSSSAKLSASIAVRVVHSQRHDGDSYLVGCTFVEPPQPETLVLFG